jgi:hypothetical protein
VQRSKNNVEKHLSLIKEYKSLYKLVKTKCRNDLRVYEDRITSNCISNPKVVHKFIRDKTVIKDDIRALMDDNNKIITDPKLICERLNQWFFSVFRKEDCVNIRTFNPSSSICSNLIVNPFDIESRLSKLDGNKSIGPDSIHPFEINNVP